MAPVTHTRHTKLSSGTTWCCRRGCFAFEVVNDSYGGRLAGVTLPDAARVGSLLGMTYGGGCRSLGGVVTLSTAGDEGACKFASHAC